MSSYRPNGWPWCRVQDITFNCNTPLFVKKEKKIWIIFNNIGKIRLKLSNSVLFCKFHIFSPLCWFLRKFIKGSLMHHMDRQHIFYPEKIREIHSVELVLFEYNRVTTKNRITQRLQKLKLDRHRLKVTKSVVFRWASSLAEQFPRWKR